MKNIEKYKGIYAISKIYLGLRSRLARQAKTLKIKRKKEPGPSKKGERHSNIRKIYQKNLSEKFIRKIYQKIFLIYGKSEKFIRKIYQKIFLILNKTTVKFFLLFRKIYMSNIKNIICGVAKRSN
nr:hypothetical protein JMPHXYHW_JMPHXYHW_CDS_0021 [uncultured phage]